MDDGRTVRYVVGAPRRVFVVATVLGESAWPRRPSVGIGLWACCLSSVCYLVLCTTR